MKVKKEVIKGEKVIKEEVIELTPWKGIRAYATDRKGFYLDLRKMEIWETNYRGGYKLGQIYGFDPKFRYTLIEEGEEK